MVVREDRKEQIIDHAVGLFAQHGYYKATTAMVAKGAGVSQPYVFHFFASKEELFNAVIDRAARRIYETFAEVEAPADRLEETMGKAFIEIMNMHRNETLVLMQAYAIAEPVIRQHVREKFRLVNEAIIAKFQRAAVPNAAVSASRFMGTGLLITVSEVLELPEMVCFK